MTEPEPITIRVVLPGHLRELAQAPEREVSVTAAAATIDGVLGALEEQYPMLRGTIRDRHTHRRRAFIRFFACERDLSHDPTDDPLPDPVVHGSEPLLIVGAMAGG